MWPSRMNAEHQAETRRWEASKRWSGLPPVDREWLDDQWSLTANPTSAAEAVLYGRVIEHWTEDAAPVRVSRWRRWWRMAWLTIAALVWQYVFTRGMIAIIESALWR